jgi:hypothetical protein
MKNLKRRIERLTKASGGDFQAKARALAKQWNIPTERVLAVTKGHEAALNHSLFTDGSLTWEAFCFLRELGLWN